MSIIGPSPIPDYRHYPGSQFVYQQQPAFSWLSVLFPGFYYPCQWLTLALKNITTDNVFGNIDFDKQEADNVKVREREGGLYCT